LNRDALYLGHILECIRRIDEDISAGRDHFLTNRTVQDAVLRNMQILSESTQRLSPEARQLRPEIPWRNIASFRNRIVHDYFNIDLDIVWGIIQNDLPALRVAVIAILNSHDTSA
jgi:uncharacterized protein with HEPN domain